MATAGSADIASCSRLTYADVEVSRLIEPVESHGPLVVGFSGEDGSEPILKNHLRTPRKA